MTAFHITAMADSQAIGLGERREIGHEVYELPG